MDDVLYRSDGFIQKFEQCFFNNIIVSFAGIVVTWMEVQATNFQRC